VADGTVEQPAKIMMQIATQISQLILFKEALLLWVNEIRIKISLIIIRRPTLQVNEQKDEVPGMAGGFIRSIAGLLYGQLFGQSPSTIPPDSLL
jgi:hypothetical protein